MSNKYTCIKCIFLNKFVSKIKYIQNSDSQESYTNVFNIKIKR